MARAGISEPALLSEHQQAAPGAKFKWFIFSACRALTDQEPQEPYRNLGSYEGHESNFYPFYEPRIGSYPSHCLRFLARFLNRQQSAYPYVYYVVPYATKTALYQPYRRNHGPRLHTFLAPLSPNTTQFSLVRNQGQYGPTSTIRPHVLFRIARKKPYTDLL